MPSHPRRKNLGKKPSVGRLVKRNSERTEEWNSVVGPSCKAIPSNKLPLIRTILQHYRTLRIASPFEKDKVIAKQISGEVTAIWDRANVPTKDAKNCTRTVFNVITKFKTPHNPNQMKEYATEMDKLLDLTPKLKGTVSESAHLENL